MSGRRPRARFRGVCALCDRTNETTQLCDACRADPANVDWAESWEQADELMDDRPAGGLANAVTRPLRQPTALQGRILDIAWRRLYCRVYVFDRCGRRRGRRWRYVDLTYREMAWLVGCDHKHVHRVLRRQVR